MTNALIASRDRFSAEHPEERVELNGREWGVVEAGGQRPGPVADPRATLGRGDIFWQADGSAEGPRARASP